MCGILCQQAWGRSFHISQEALIPCIIYTASLIWHQTTPFLWSADPIRSNESMRIRENMMRRRWRVGVKRQENTGLSVYLDSMGVRNVQACDDVLSCKIFGRRKFILIWFDVITSSWVRCDRIWFDSMIIIIILSSLLDVIMKNCSASIWNEQKERKKSMRGRIMIDEDETIQNIWWGRNNWM